MTKIIAAILALLVSATVPISAAILHGGGSNITNPSMTVPLVRVFNQPAGTTTPAVAIWPEMGQPSGDGDIPSGDIVTATLGGNIVKVRGCDIHHHVDGSTSWQWLWVDYSGQTITPGGSSTLQLTATPGSWSGVTTRTTADWGALGVQIQLTNLSTTGISAPDMNGAGTWVADFNPATASIRTLCTNSIGRADMVTAHFVNSVTHRMLLGRITFFVSEKSDGSLGPIAASDMAVENMQAFPSVSGGFASFTYTAALVVNGVTLRSYPGVTSYWGDSQSLMRPDGQWDWLTGTDPQLVVTQDYNLVRKTHKIPPLLPGLLTGSNYLGAFPTSAAVTAVDTTTGIFTFASNNALTEPSVRPSTAIDFFGTTPPGGVVFGQVYWGCYSNPTQAKIYDSYSDAAVCSAAGQIIPTSAGSGVSAEIAIAPNTSAQQKVDQGGTGDSPFIGLIPEWSAGYLIGNTAAWQRMSRINAFVEWQIPTWAQDTNGTVLSYEISSRTPSTGTNFAGGTGLISHQNTVIEKASSGGTMSTDVNGGVKPLGGAGVWSALGIIDYAHWPNAMYIPWLMTGDPGLQYLLLQNAQRGIGVENTDARRNATIGGTQYFANVLLGASPGVVRQSAWSMRDLGEALFAASDNSAEHSLLINELNDSINGFLAYRGTIKGTNYQNMGIIFDDDNVATITIHFPFGSNFMTNFMLAALADIYNLDGSLITNISTVANLAATTSIGFYTVNCGYYATTYNIGWSVVDHGSPSPGNYVSGISEVGYGNNATANFTSGNPNIALNDSESMGSAGTNMAVGWKVRFLNMDSDSNVWSDPPSPFVSGTDYYVLSLSGGTAQLGTTPSGPALTPTSTVKSGSVYIPVGGTCPSSGTLLQDTNGSTTYFQAFRAALGYLAAMGVTGLGGVGTAESAYQIASLRATIPLSGATGFAGGSKWAFGDTW